MTEKAEQTMTTAEILEKHAKYLIPAVKNYYKEPLVAVQGKGARVTDINGDAYLDFFGGILTISVGHANEEVNAAITAQLNRLAHITTLYPTLPIVELAERLARITPGRLQKCFFSASGTGADEVAVTLAQTYTGNHELVALRHGYHGNSTLAQSLTAHQSWRSLPSQIAGVKHALSPYCYRCPLKQTYPSCGVACAQDVEELIQTTTTGSIAGMIAEPIQGVGGFITPPREYFEIVAKIVRKYGGLFISDEVQTGFGRTGTMWGIEQYGVEPDMMTMAKGIANGLPLGAVIATPEVADSLVKNMLNTFGGNPLSCASANATINIVERDDLAGNARELGAILREGMERIRRANPKVVGDVRGMGLMQAFELVVDETAGDRTPNAAATNLFMEETRKRRLLLGKGGLHGNVIRISPALNITRDEVDEALRIMGESFEAMN